MSLQRRLVFFYDLGSNLAGVSMTLVMHHGNVTLMVQLYQSVNYFLDWRIFFVKFPVSVPFDAVPLE
jgi:hypothetical protein